MDISKSHSRPYTSDDNPFSEAQSKTLKYHPDFPERFGCIKDARAHCQTFFAWYNNEHRHSGIAHMTAHGIHHGLAMDLIATRQASLDVAFGKHPNRFKSKRPAPTKLPTAAWINPPPEKKTETKISTEQHTLLSNYLLNGDAKSLTRSERHDKLIGSKILTSQA